MHNLTGTQELDDVIDIRVIGKTENVVIRYAGLLFCCKVLSQIGDGIAGDLHCCGGPGVAGGKLREYTGGVVHEVRVKPGGSDLLLGQISGQLMDQCTYYFQMSQLLCADIGQQTLELGIGHGVALGKIAQGSAQLAIWATILRNNHSGELGIRCCNLYRVLQLFFINKHQSFPPNSQGHGSLSQV